MFKFNFQSNHVILIFENGANETFLILPIMDDNKLPWVMIICVIYIIFEFNWKTHLLKSNKEIIYHWK